MPIYYPQNGNNIAVNASTAVDNSLVVFSNSNGVSFGMDANGVITASVNAAGGGDGFNIIAAGGSTANTTGTINFANSNGISFGLNGAVVTASHNGITQQSTQPVAYSVGNGSQLFSTIKFADSNGLSFSSGTQGIYGIYTVPTQSVQPVAASAANGSFLFSTLVFANSNGISFSTGTQGVYASHNGITQQTTQPYNILSAGTQVANTSGTVAFANSNGISFGMNGNSAITASYTVPTQTVQPVAASAANGSFLFSTVAFANSNGVSFSTGTQGIFATVRTDYQSSNANYLTSQSNQAVSGANGSFTFQTLSFANSNGISWSTGTQGVFATVKTDYQSSNANYLTSQSNQAVSGANGSFTFQTLSFANSNGVSFSTGTQGVYASVDAGGGGAAIQGSGTYSQNTGTIQFANSNGVTFGLSNNGVMTASVQAGAAAGVGGVVIGGSTLTSGTLGFDEGNTGNVTFGWNGSTITASVNAGAVYSLRRYPELPVPLASSSMYSGATGATGGSSQTTASLYVAPLILPHPVAFNELEIYASHGSVGTSNSTWQQTIAHMVGLYTLDTAGGTTALRSVSTWQLQLQFTASSNTAITGLAYWGTNSTRVDATTGFTGNSTAAITGLKNLKLCDFAQTIGAGQYWIVHAFTNRTSNVNMWASPNTGMYLSFSQTTGAQYLGITTGGTQPPYRYMGIVSTTSNGTTTGYNILPASINSTAITNTGGSSQWRWLVPNLYV